MERTHHKNVCDGTRNIVKDLCTLTMANVRNDHLILAIIPSTKRTIIQRSWGYYKNLFSPIGSENAFGASVLSARGFTT